MKKFFKFLGIGVGVVVVVFIGYAVYKGVFEEKENTVTVTVLTPEKTLIIIAPVGLKGEEIPNGKKYSYMDQTITVEGLDHSVNGELLDYTGIKKITITITKEGELKIKRE
jgi:uncharacterized membrane protein YukC